MDAAAIVAALGGASKVAASLGLPANTVTYWVLRGSIPSTRWADLVALPDARRVGVTLEILARHRSRRNPTVKSAVARVTHGRAAHVGGAD